MISTRCVVFQSRMKMMGRFDDDFVHHVHVGWGKPVTMANC